MDKFLLGLLKGFEPTHLVIDLSNVSKASLSEKQSAESDSTGPGHKASSFRMFRRNLKG